MGSPAQNFAPEGDIAGMTLEEAFPVVDPGHIPLGSKVIVQVRAAKRHSAGGIELPDEVRNTIAANTQVARVISIGPNAFHSKDGKAWPEGPWFQVGDFVRCPLHGGDRWERKLPDENEFVLFYLFDHLQFSALVTDPLKITAFV